jgi:hypothetical protein
MSDAQGNPKNEAILMGGKETSLSAMENAARNLGGSSTKILESSTGSKVSKVHWYGDSPSKLANRGSTSSVRFSWSGAPSDSRFRQLIEDASDWR